MFREEVIKLVLMDKQPRQVLREHFEQAGRWKKFSRGEALLTQEEDASSVLLLVQGSLEVQIQSPNGEQLSLTTLCEGDIFGELGLLTHGIRSASVVARTKGKALLLYQSEFFHLLQREPAVVRALLEILALRIFRLTRQVKLLREESRRKRLAQALLFFYQFPEYCPQSLTIAYLSRFCNISYRHIFRLLNEFAAKGWIAPLSERATIRIKDADGLESLL